MKIEEKYNKADNLSENTAVRKSRPCKSRCPLQICMLHLLYLEYTKKTEKKQALFSNSTDTKPSAHSDGLRSCAGTFQNPPGQTIL
ncbi:MULTISPECIES: hypothetical protein [Blautia]|uniref:hypothetical protein n=1 Tax=Blautia TaxID=572511 RepID=UPI0011CC7DC4|nr:MULTISPECIES: hypothetical protein [Blautia]